jgi:hypothetical protein
MQLMISHLHIVCAPVWGAQTAIISREPPRFVVAEAACVSDLVSDSGIKMFVINRTALQNSQNRVERTCICGYVVFVDIFGLQIHPDDETVGLRR